MILSFVIIVMTLTLRSVNVGVDTSIYFEEYNTISKLSFSQLRHHRMELGFVLLVKLISMINLGPQLLLVVTGVFMAVSVFHLIKKYSPNKFLSIYLFITLMFLMTFMNVMRQSISICILIYSIKYIDENKNLKAILIILLASLFHFVAIVFLPIIILRRFKIDYKVMIFTLALSFVIFLSFDLFINTAALFIPKVKYYLDSIYGKENYFGALLDYIFYFSIYMVVIVNLKKTKTKEQKIFLSILIIQMILQPLLIKMTIMNRVSTIFSFFIIITIPLIINNSSKRIKFVSYLFIISISLIYFIIIGYFRPEWNGAIPFEFFWRSQGKAVM